MAVTLRVAEEARGEAVRLERDRLLVCVPVPWAPGQPVRFTVSLPARELALHGRCQRVRRLADGRYEAWVRLVGLRRPEREALGDALRV